MMATTCKQVHMQITKFQCVDSTIHRSQGLGQLGKKEEGADSLRQKSMVFKVRCSSLKEHIIIVSIFSSDPTHRVSSNCYLNGRLRAVRHFNFSYLVHLLRIFSFFFLRTYFLELLLGLL